MDDILPNPGRWDLENVDRFDYPRRNSAVSDPIPVRVRQVAGPVRRNGRTITLEWPGDGTGEGQMGNVG